MRPAVTGFLLDRRDVVVETVGRGPDPQRNDVTFHLAELVLLSDTVRSGILEKRYRPTGTPMWTATMSVRERLMSRIACPASRRMAPSVR
jgi:hypothetical protein